MDRRTIKNYVYNLAYQILLLLAPLITTPYVSGVLNSEGIGIYSYTFSLASAFSLVAALGVNSYGQREIAYRQGDGYARSKIFWELFAIRVVVSTVAVVIYLVFSLAYEEYRPYLLAQTFVVVAVLVDISWFFQGMEDFKLIAIRNTLIKLAAIAAIFLLVKTEDDLLVYCLINAASIFVGNALLFVGLGRHIQRVPVRELDLLRHVPGTIEFFIPIIAVQIYSQLDKIMLGAMLNNNAQNGYYEQARKVSNLIVTVVVSLNTVLFSRNANLFSEGRKAEVRDSMRESFVVMCMIMLPLVVGLFSVTDNLVGWFFGPGWEPVVVLLRLSCPLIVFMCVGNFVGMQYLAPLGHQNQMTVAYIIAAIVNVIANFFLIPPLMAQGSLIASIAAELCSCGIQLWLLARSEYRFSPFHDLVPYLIAVAVMCLVLLGWQRVTPLAGLWQTVSEIAIGAAVYAAILLVQPGTVVRRVATKLWERVRS